MAPFVKTIRIAVITRTAKCGSSTLIRLLGVYICFLLAVAETEENDLSDAFRMHLLIQAATRYSNLLWNRD